MNVIMKSLYKMFLLFAAIMTVVSSCSEDKEFTKIMNPDEVDAPTVTAPEAGDEFILSLDDKDELAMVIRWDRSDFGVDLKMDFSVDIDVKGGDFTTSAINLALTTADSLALTQGELNKKLLELGFKADESGEFDIRIVSKVNYQIEDKTSEVVTVSATPYSTIFPSIYMIGAAVGGWDPALAVEIASTGEPNKFYTKAYFDAETDANFRFFTAPDWGSSLGGYDVFPNYPTELLGETGDGDSNFLFIGATGWYELWVDQGTGTIQMKATAEPLLYLTGDATHGWGWDNPTSIKWTGHFTWEGDVTFNQDKFFRLFEQPDWGPVGYGHDIISTYNETYMIIAEGHGDPNWQFVGPTGSYHILVNKREGTFSINKREGTFSITAN